MDDGIALESAFISVVEDAAAGQVGIYTQVANAEAFKDESERAQVVDEVLRPGAKGGRCYRGVDEVAGGRGSDGRFRAQVRAPCGKSSTT